MSRWAIAPVSQRTMSRRAIAPVSVRGRRNRTLSRAGSTECDLRKGVCVMALVLTRKVGETVEIPALGIVITPVRVNGQRVRLKIDAPASVRVLRGELQAAGQVPPAESGQQRKAG